MWIGTTKTFQAHDTYVEDTGRLQVYLFGRIRIVNETGPHMDQGELLRWLGEAVWFPTALLPRRGKSSEASPGYSGRLEWSSIDNNTARVDFEYNGISVWYIVTINDAGQITRLETERYMEEGRLERWEGRVSDYQQVNGMMVPMRIEASWLLPDYTHTYAQFQVRSLEYNTEP